MKEIRVMKAGLFWKTYFWLNAKLMGSNKIMGFTTYWHTIVVREEHLFNKRLLAHELTHVKQIDDLGLFKFTWLYCKEWIKVGYRENRFEIEAREASKNPDKVIKNYILRY